MENGKVGLAIVGYGYWGPNLVRNYLECQDCTIEWVCDNSEAQLNKLKRKHPFLKVSKNYNAILDDEKVDAVVISTPISTHHSLAKKALLKGKHVFVEKPLAHDSKKAEELVSLAKKQRVTLMVGHTFIYSSPVIKVKEIIQSGELGEIYYISSSRVNLGLHQRDVSVIWDLAPHDFSILFYWLGEEPSNIFAFGKACLRPDIPDIAFVNLHFPSGTIAETQLSWLSPVKLRRTVVVGDQKMLLYDDTEGVEKVKIFDHGVDFVDPESYGEYQLSYRTGNIVSPQLKSYEPLHAEANHFLDCVRTGKKPKTDGEDGVQVVKALELADDCLRKNLIPPIPFIVKDQSVLIKDKSIQLVDLKN